TMPPALTAYMLPHRHTALTTALYGPTHGTGERVLALTLLSGERQLSLNGSLLCRYENNVPVLETNNVGREEWAMLRGIVEKEGVVRVILNEADDGGGSDGRDYLARFCVEGGGGLRDGGVEVSVKWKEEEGLGVRDVLGRGVEWVREKLA
ncbi:hypothetical protein CC86DRAFT_431677, partial [Ophiobolus disseminans]